MKFCLPPSCCLLPAFCLLTLTAASAAEDAPRQPAEKPATAATVSFRNDVWPILKRHCWGCHSRADRQGGLSVGSVGDMLEGGDSGPLFAAGKPDDSLLLEMVSGESPSMPKEQPPISLARIQTLKQWILEGAHDDTAGAPVRPEVSIPEYYRFLPAVSSVALNQAGTTVAAACRSEVVLIDLTEEKEPMRLATGSDLLTHVEFSPDGKLLAAIGGLPAVGGEVRLFDATTGTQLSTRELSTDTLFRGSFSPDSSAIALGGADGAVHVVPVDSEQPVRSFDLHSDWVLDVAWTPDGTKLVTAGRDKATRIAAADTGVLLRSLDSSTEMVTGIAADNEFAISAGRARLPVSYEFKIALQGIEVTGAGNGARPVSRRAQYARNLEGQAGEVLAMAHSGDHSLTAVAGSSGEVRVYRIATRERVALIGGLPAPVFGVALNGDGSRLATGSRNGEVRIYQLPEGKLLKSLIPVPLKKDQPAPMATAD